MKHSIDQYPLLYQLFLKLQTYDRNLGHQSLGVEEYYALMEGLKKGLKINDEEQFKKVLCLIWRKPHHDKEVFNQLLEEGLQYIYEKSTNQDGPVNDQPKTDAPGAGDDFQLPKTTKDKEKDRSPSIEGKTPLEGSPKQKERLEEDTLIISFEKASPDKDQAGLQLDIDQISGEINKYHYLLEGNYFELGSRQLQQGFRVMRRQEMDKTKKEIDLDATIFKASRQGFLEDLEYRYGYKWITDLLVLIDHGESMVAFRPFAEELLAVFKEDYGINKSVYFFKEAPYQNVFADQSHRQGISVNKLAEAPAQPLLIISEAGAATGRVDEDRVEDTVAFLAQIRNHRVAWLNPMPRDRWKGTSAEYIALYTSMFFLDPTELVNVVKLFKAKMKTNTLLDQYVQANGR